VICFFIGDAESIEDLINTERISKAAVKSVVPFCPLQSPAKRSVYPPYPHSLTLHDSAIVQRPLQGYSANTCSNWPFFEGSLDLFQLKISFMS